MMNEINVKRFRMLLEDTHSNCSGIYTLYDNTGKFIETEYDTDFETDNGLDEGDERYEEYLSILFREISTGKMVEVNYHSIPVKVLHDGVELYS